MIARPHEPGLREPAGAADRLRVAGRAAGRLRDDATRLVLLRRDDLAAGLRRALWRVAAAVMLLLAGATAVVTATVLTLRGLAGWLDVALGGEGALGALAVGAAVLLLFLMAVAWGVRDPRRARRAAERAQATDDLRRDGRRLVRAIGVVPGAAIAAASGFTATRLLRHRSVRRAALFGLGMLRRSGLGGGGGSGVGGDAA